MKFNHQAAVYKAAAVLLVLFGFVTTSAQAQEAGITPGTSEELEVGDLVFKITALRVSQPERNQASVATLSMQVRNQGAVPVSLCVGDNSAQLVNDLGYVWGSRGFNNKVTGVCVSTSRKASVDYVVLPGKDLRMQFQLKYGLKEGQTLGSSYDFAADFASYRDAGEGRLDQVARYPVSFVGLQRSGALQGAADDVKNIGSDAKRALGTLFGK